MKDLIVNTPDYYDPESILWHATVEHEHVEMVTPDLALRLQSVALPVPVRIAAAAAAAGFREQLAENESGSVEDIKARVRMPYLFCK